MALELHIHRVAAHELSQLVVHDLYHPLLGLHGGEHILPQCLLLHGIGEGLGHLVIDIGVQQCATHVFQCLGNVNLGYLALALQNLE